MAYVLGCWEQGGHSAALSHPLSAWDFKPIRREENVRGKFECKKKIQASIFSSKSKDDLLKVIMKKDSFFLKIFFNVYLLIF